MEKITRESTPEQIDAYWKEVLSYRMEKRQEVNRLKNIGLGFYLQHLDFKEKEDNDYKEHDSFLDFIENNKRPFGNKSKAESIIYNLGWDTQWIMTFHPAPNWVREEANEIYRLLIDSLKEKGSDEEIIWRL